MRAGPSPSCSWSPSRFSDRRLMFGPACRLRARAQHAVDQLGDPVSRRMASPGEIPTAIAAIEPIQGGRLSMRLFPRRTDPQLARSVRTASDFP